MATEEYLRQLKYCEEQNETFNKSESELYCNAIFDQFLCWGYTKAGTSVSQNCPPDLPLIDTSSYEKFFVDFSKGNEDLADKAIRHCGIDGNWLDRNNESSSTGWTDFIKCFPPFMQDLLENASKSTEGFLSLIEVATWVRNVEFLGLIISSIALITALIVFKKYPSLMNNRTNVHYHFFRILLVQCLTALFIYTDQKTLALLSQHNVACILVYTLYELLTSIAFAFMLIEGVVLYGLVSKNALRPQISNRVPITLAYSGSIINASIWFITAISVYGLDENTRCWYGYNLGYIYWILQVPRLCIVGTNVLLMLLVLKTLLEKIEQKDKSEVGRIRKLVRATVLMMPLLGITNVISLTHAPLKDTTVVFAIWAFVAYFLRSLQGFFVAYIYCFRNAEVREVVLRQTKMKLNERNDQAVHYRADAHECEMLRHKDETSMEPPDDPQLDTTRDLDETQNMEPPDDPQLDAARDLDETQKMEPPDDPQLDTARDLDEVSDLSESKGEKKYALTEVVVHRSE